MGEHTDGQEWHTCWLPGHCQTQHVLPDAAREPAVIRCVRRIVEQDASLLQLEDLLDTSNVNPPVWAFE